jgi:4-amino-4-deoxy-L-arabinose transferase-like glycosyltransferase
LTIAAPTERRESRRDLALLALLAACLYLPGLGLRDLWNPDEPRYAQVAREMLASGSFLVPHYNDRLYTEKPPLMFWAMAASGALRGGLDETAARLPSALAAIGGVLLVYAAGRRLFDRRAAWIAALACGTSTKVLWQARTGQIDMLLTFLVLCAVYSWLVGRLERRPGYSYLFFAFAGLATLAKGPVGLLPPLLSILAFLAVTRDREGLSHLRLGRGLLVWAGVVLLWLAPAIIAGGDTYSREILLRQNVTRYVTPWGHYHAPWYFAQVMPVDFLPWSLFVPAAIAGCRRLDPARRRHVLFLGCWIAVTVLFFSVSPGKRSVYVLTCYPALALLTGAGLAVMTRGQRPGRGWVLWPASAWTLLLWILAFAVPHAARWVPVPSLAAPLLVPVALCLGVIAAASTVATWLALRGRHLALACALAGGLAVAWLAISVDVLPRLDPELSLRSMADTIAREKPAGTALASYHEMEGGLLFYGSGFARELRDEEELEALLRREPAWVVIDPDDVGGLSRPLDLRVVALQGESGDGVRLLASP